MTIESRFLFSFKFDAKLNIVSICRFVRVCDQKSVEYMNYYRWSCGLMYWKKRNES